MANHQESEYDAVIIGAGHNAIVTGVYLARAGWKVLIVERNKAAGGAVRTAEVTLPGFRHDLFATNLNLFANSPFYMEFKDELHKNGLELVRSSKAFGSVFPDGDFLGISQDMAHTLESIRGTSARDAESWQDLYEKFTRTAPHLFPLLGAEMPSWKLARGILGGIRSGGFGWLTDTMKLLVSSPRDFLDMHFESEKVKALLAVWGMHVDFAPEVAGGALMCYLESMANQTNGMFIGRGGCENLIMSLVGVYEDLGGEIMYESEAGEIVLSSGRAAGVKLHDGRLISARRCVIAGVAPPLLFGKLIDAGSLPDSFSRAVTGYRYGPGTMMIHLALESLPEWKAGDEPKQYMYVHIAPYMKDMSQAYAEAVSGLLPSSPVLVVGQPTTVDATRAPDGKHVLWIQVRPLPSRIVGDAAGEIDSRDWDDIKEAYADRIIDKLDIYAPGIRRKILFRAVFSPADLERENPNLVGGDSTSGSHHLYQNYFMRPFPGWSRYKTPIRNLYMVGASTWPGAGVGAGSGRLLGRMLT